MAAADVLLLWAEAKDLLNYDDSEMDRTVYLLDVASVVCNRYTRRLLASRAHTIIIDGSGGQSLLLPEYPITALTKVYIDSDRAFAAASEVTDCIYYADRGELWRSGGFPLYTQNVKVQYTAGYTTGPAGTIPADIRVAVCEIVQWYRHRLEAEGMGLRSIQSPDGTISQYELDLPFSARMRLDPYKRIA